MENIIDYKSLFIGAVITLVVQLIAQFIQWYIGKDKVRLRFSIKHSSPFPMGASTAKVFEVLLKNKGNKPVLDCNYKVSINQGQIDSHRFANDKLVSDVVATDNVIECLIPYLNSRESIQLTITSKGDNISNPKVEARAVGVNAKKEVGYRPWLPVVTIIAVLFGLYMSLGNPSKGVKNQDEIFSILNRSGLSNSFPQLVNSSSDNITFKNTGYFLFHHFLIDEQRRDKYVLAMEELTKVDGLSGNSKCVILYLLSKAEKVQNDKTKATQYLNASKDADRETFDYLMEQDSSYDLISLQKWLMENWKSDSCESTK